ncbi:hypothetical protein ARMSODRAFT_470088 [Armillaria solidipes]|uniref:Uncharacterized protein n=1 Tax=Armillaria solidipes TaxID=1076256 RepID=A0A2H3BMM3_9AGAR|nr:hypothetical protein ARMSODRAFT_470088 [Armillaria solidipes]
MLLRSNSTRRVAGPCAPGVRGSISCVDRGLSLLPSPSFPSYFTGPQRSAPRKSRRVWITLGAGMVLIFQEVSLARRHVFLKISYRGGPCTSRAPTSMVFSYEPIREGIFGFQVSF